MDPEMYSFWGGQVLEKARKQKGFEAFPGSARDHFWSHFWIVPGTLLGPLQAPVLVPFCTFLAFPRVGRFGDAHWLVSCHFCVFKHSEQLNFQFNYHRPRRVGKFPVQIPLDFGVFKLSRQLLSEQQFQLPSERCKLKVCGPSFGPVFEPD